MDTSQYLDLFIDETKEHLQSLNEHVLVLEKEPDDADTINEIFRAAHTLKGVCLNLGFKVLYESTYNITEALRPGNPKLGKEELHNLFKELDKDYNIVINGIKLLD